MKRLGIAIVLLHAAVAAAAPSAADVVKRVQAHYANVAQLTATFRQHVTQAAFGTEKVSEGEVQLAKPTRMRWDYRTKSKVTRSFISDGTNLYEIDHPNHQVTRVPLGKNQLPVVLSFLYGQGNLAATFDATIDATSPYATQTTIVLALTPKQPSAQYASLVLVVDTTDDHVVQSIITDANHNTNRFELANQDTKAAIPAARFAFDPKRDVPSTYKLVTP